MLIESVPVGRFVQFVRRTPAAASSVGDESQARVPYNTGLQTRATSLTLQEPGNRVVRACMHIYI